MLRLHLAGSTRLRSFESATIPQRSPSIPVTSPSIFPPAIRTLTPSTKPVQWACNTNTGFNTETQTWYTVLEDGTWLMCQVIWSYVGYVPSIRFFPVQFEPKADRRSMKH